MTGSDIRVVGFIRNQAVIGTGILIKNMCQNQTVSIGFNGLSSITSVRSLFKNLLLAFRKKKYKKQE